MTEYKGFKYDESSTNMYRLIFPTGFKTFVAATSENEVKKIIDSLIADHRN